MSSGNHMIDGDPGNDPRSPKYESPLNIIWERVELQRQPAYPGSNEIRERLFVHGSNHETEEIKLIDHMPHLNWKKVEDFAVTDADINNGEITVKYSFTVDGYNQVLSELIINKW